MRGVTTRNRLQLLVINLELKVNMSKQPAWYRSVRGAENETRFEENSNKLKKNINASGRVKDHQKDRVRVHQRK